MRRTALALVLAVFAAPAVYAQQQGGGQRTGALTRGLADALYLSLGGGTVTGTLTVNNLTIGGTCTGCSTGSVPTTRTISTTSPLGGGGDLSANRTFTCTTCATSANDLSFFSATTSAQLRTLLSDENGTGAALFDGATSPTFITPALGTPSAAVLTNATGTASGLTAGNVTTNANLTGPITSAGNETSITSQTGTGTKFVVDTSPTIITPTITTSINVPLVKPPSDSTTAFKVTKTDGTTAVTTWDTTNARVGINMTPSFSLDLTSTFAGSDFIRFLDSSTVGGANVLLKSGNGTTSARINYVEFFSNETTSQDWVAGMNGTKNYVIRDNTAGSDRVTVNQSTGDVSFATTITPSQTSGIVGTTTNNNANAGSFGEYKNAQCPGPATTATITVTIATPGVVTWSGHPFSGTAPRSDVCPVVFTTGGALPTGITASTTYWIIPSTISGNNFSIATSVDNAIAGTAINTTGSQSGTHTGTASATLATATTGNIAGVSLTAGDWDCRASVAYTFGASTSYTNLIQGIGTTSVTVGAQGTFTDYETPATVPTASADMTWVTPVVRELLSGTSTIYLLSRPTFTLSTLRGYGNIDCRRMR